MPTNSALLAVAIQAATTAAHHALSQRGRRHDADLVARHDIKLKLDVECQEIAARTILGSFPGHAILGEESETGFAKRGGDAASGESDYEWVVDPIDGTVNFFHGSAYWCCSVAVRRRSDGEALAGCVCAPDMGRTFWASADGPAICNGDPIRVSATDSVDQSIVLTGADKSEDPARRPFRFFNALAERCQRPRVCGAAALDICFVASGAADGYFEPGIFIWDIAAADLVLRRAGGRGTVMREFGGHRLAYFGSNGILHDELTSIVDPLFIDKPN